MTATLQSPVGPLSLVVRGGRIRALRWAAEAGGIDTDPADLALMHEALAQLAAYFDRRLTRFDLPLEVGAGRQADVLRALLAIPYGRTRSYGDLARELGMGAQAMGRACGSNPLPILIPCHRVVSATGLGGYSGAGGIETKVLLLRLEGAAGLLL